MSNFRMMLEGRWPALLALALISAFSFVLGYLVGNSTHAPVRTAAPVAKEQRVPADPGALSSRQNREIPFPSQTAVAPSVQTTDAESVSVKSEPSDQNDPDLITPSYKPPKASPPKRTKNASSTAAAPSVTTTPSSGDGRPFFSVQVGAFERMADAEEMRKGFISKGYRAYVLRESVKGQAIFKVRIGQYADIDKARDLTTKLRMSESIESFVVESR